MEQLLRNVVILPASYYDALMAAAREVLRGGEHDGPCSPISDYEPCELHSATAQLRQARLQELIEGA